MNAFVLIGRQKEKVSKLVAIGTSPLLSLCWPVKRQNSQMPNLGWQREGGPQNPEESVGQCKQRMGGLYFYIYYYTPGESSAWRLLPLFPLRRSDEPLIWRR